MAKTEPAKPETDSGGGGGSQKKDSKLLFKGVTCWWHIVTVSDIDPPFTSGQPIAKDLKLLAIVAGFSLLVPAVVHGVATVTKLEELSNLPATLAAALPGMIACLLFALPLTFALWLLRGKVHFNQVAAATVFTMLPWYGLAVTVLGVQLGPGNRPILLFYLLALVGPIWVLAAGLERACGIAKWRSIVAVLLVEAVLGGALTAWAIDHAPLPEIPQYQGKAASNNASGLTSAVQPK